MKKSIADGDQNAEVSIHIPCEKSPEEQLEIMENYTRTHMEYKGLDKATREIQCLKVLYPRVFRHIENTDLIAGRMDFLPIGFGCVTSQGGVGHYCVFHKLRDFQGLLQTPDERKRVDRLYEYWAEEDLKAKYCNDVLDEKIGRFIDCKYPLMATARLSGMMLDYEKLLSYGIDGLIQLISNKPSSAFIDACMETMHLFKDVIRKQMDFVKEAFQEASEQRKQELQLMYDDLEFILDHKPETFHQALQLFYLYALCSGAINYGRLDTLLGSYVKRDIEQGILNEEEAIRYLKSLWLLIENRRTTVNGRIIVGGYGRKDQEAADYFTRLCLRVCKETRYVEPQFTLRLTKDTPRDIVDMAYECISSGATYPTLYNDEVNIPAVEYAMRVDRKRAEQYVPFGCGEFVIQGKSVGTPNILLNMLKVQQLVLNQGIDPMDGVYKAGPISIPPLSEFKTFNDLYEKYKELLEYYYDQSIEKQLYSYRIMNQEVSFLFTSILMDDCLERGKALLDGGVEVLGGTIETYGNINSSDALYAIKKLVYDERKYTLEELNTAARHNFVGYEKIRKDLWNAPKYGNDHKECDDLANDLYKHVSQGIRNRGITAQMGYYLIVISNNHVNTEWGRETDASLDGRKKGVFMNPANNPQGGATRNGPTAMLNSLAKFDARYHGGSVQNIKFTPRMMHEDKEKVQALFRTYFRKGGCQLMVTVVDPGVLQDAQKHPDKYPDLLVRVAGYSAKFVNLPKDVQDEVISRGLHD